MTEETDKRSIPLWLALLPLLFLITMLAASVSLFSDNSSYGPNQIALMLAAGAAALIGLYLGESWADMERAMVEGISLALKACLILLAVGSLIGSWMLAGTAPAVIYAGLGILDPSWFYPAALIICALVAVSIGSSWTTAGTVGIALMGIAQIMGLSLPITAGAVISGAYFGDKMSPLSDTTNLAAAMAGSDLFAHIRYMMLTTVPTYIITLITFVLIGLNYQPQGVADSSTVLAAIDSAFYITPWLLLVPLAVVGLIIFRTRPLIALLAGALLGGLFAVIFQPGLVMKIAEADVLNFQAAYQGVIKAMTVSTGVETNNAALNDLFATKGMAGMMPTVWLVICAMTFGGVMEAIGALACISAALLRLAHSIFGLFASTVASCLALNATASDQYLAIVIPGKMFSKAYAKRGLAPVNLSRTLEDSGTVTSVLVPWNTCGAYQSRVLGVDTWHYLPYAVFNYVSPFMTLLFAALQIKIRQALTQEPETAEQP